MIKVEMWKTLDGTMHKTAEEAKRYADAKYTHAVTSLAGILITLDKYQKIKTFIDQNLDRFVALSALKADMQIPEDSEE